jgi:hypothetical protein
MHSRVICVLGMHRSGTSCLTGCLEEAGVFLGDLGDISTANPHNLKGHRENTKIIAMHKRLLHANGASWYDPPRRVRWYPENRHERDAIIREYQGIASWGFKDPRTVLAIEGWLEALPELVLAGIFRHPLAVAQSLQRRDNFPIRKGLNLWVHYNERLLAQHRKTPFPVLSFDFEPEVFKQKLGEVLRALDLSSDGANLSFFEPELRHEQSKDSQPLPSHVTSLYAELQKIAA